ncbi:MAG: hypothetical protein M3N82_17050 [Pseudomonadota bacterium]|nr:hypothetical protein [Pseudomonadota bacterium]
MSEPHIRKARTAIALAVIAGDGAATTLPAGEWFVEQHAAVVQVFGDPRGTQHVADLAVVDFLDGLAKRHIVFVSWG